MHHMAEKTSVSMCDNDERRVGFFFFNKSPVSEFELYMCCFGYI